MSLSLKTDKFENKESVIVTVMSMVPYKKLLLLPQPQRVLITLNQ